MSVALATPKVVVVMPAYNAGRTLRIAEIAVPTRYFPEASSASFFASVGYGLRILAVLFCFTLNQRGLRRSRRFDRLRPRYSRLP